MDDAEREGFFISPDSQNVLSQFWAGFHMGIQRCGTLLIRLLCQVPAPSVPGCSTGISERDGWWEGTMKHPTLTSWTVSFNDGRPNAQEHEPS